MKRLLFALFMLAAATPAFASDCWNNVAGTQTNCAEVPVFLNGSNQTVPISAANPLPITGGGASSTFGAVFPSVGTAVGAEYLSSPPTLTNGQMVPFFVDVNGNLLINSPSILAAISAPITPCTTANCSAENPIGPVLIAGLAQGSATGGQTGVMAMAGTTPSTVNLYNAAPLNTAGQTYPLMTNPFGALHVANGTYVATTTPTVQSAHGYTAGQEVGGFINMNSGTSTGTAQGRLLSLTVISRAVNTNYFDACLFYNVSIAGTYTDGSVPVAASADWNKQWKCVQLNNPNSDIGTGTIWQADNLNLGLQFTTWGVVLIDKSGTFTTSASTSDVQVVGTLAY